MEEDTVNLGGNISLTGFNEVEPAQMVVVKKIVGTYAKKFSENINGFENLSLRLKSIHDTNKPKKFQLSGKVIAKGNPINAENTERNLFFLIDNVLKKIEDQSVKK